MTGSRTRSLLTTLMLAACGNGVSGPPQAITENHSQDAGNASGGSGGSGTPDAGVSGTGGRSDAASPDTASSESKAALEQLQGWLALDWQSRPALEAQAFAKTALSKSDTVQAQALLWEDFATHVRMTRAEELGASTQVYRTISIGDVNLRYYKAVRGEKPAGGFSLFISMHGGGGVDPSLNDDQWRNQLALVTGYNPKNAIWVAPRAPTDEWNMWFREHMDGLFERLITNFIVFEEVDPNRIYLTGYSAGGDGAYQLGPRMADCWAGVGMSAGHPNDASPLNMRNTAFALHAGALDTAFNRNVLVETWGKQLDDLASADPDGYAHQWEVHEGYGHWMELNDAVSIPFLQGYTRNPIPNRVVWRQAAQLRQRFYWLAVDPSAAREGSEVIASYTGNLIELSGVKNLTTLTIRLSDAMLDLEQPLRVRREGMELFAGVIPRTVATLYRTLMERGDPELTFSAEVTLDLN